MIRECLRREGLFLTDLEASFFESYLQSQNGLEIAIDAIKEKVAVRLKNSKENIWHCIFDVVLKEVFDDNIGEYLQLNKYTTNENLENLLSEFYRDPFFLKLDVAQKLLYNLERLCDYEMYDIETVNGFEMWEKQFVKYMEQKEEIETDVFSGLVKLRDKRKKHEKSMRIFFPEITNDGRIMVETSFRELNILYLTNEKYVDYLCHNRYDLSWYSVLVESIKKFHVTEELHYVWEKATNFNTINLISKFSEEFMRKKGVYNNDMLQYLKRNIGELQDIFLYIQQMPNILTRLLVLKQSFNYILNNGNLEDNLFESEIYLLKNFLARNNYRYAGIQKDLLEISVLIRWKLECERDSDIRNRWADELKKEYPMEMFETLFLSLSIKKSVYHLSDYVEYNGTQTKMWDEKCRCLAWRGRSGLDDVFCYLQKEKLLKVIDENRYEDCVDNLCQALMEQGWISGEALCAIVSRDASIDMSGESERLKKEIENWLLSEEVGVIFESIHISKKCEEIFKFLLYHIY